MKNLKFTFLLILLSLSLLFCACGGNKTEAKNDIFTDEFFADVVKTDIYGEEFPAEGMRELTEALKALEIGAEGKAPSDSETSGKILNFTLENGDVYNVCVTPADDILINVTKLRGGDPGNSERIVFGRAVKRDGGAELCALADKYACLAAKSGKLPDKTASENAVFTQKYLGGVRKISLRYGIAEYERPDGKVSSEKLASYEIGNEKTFYEFLRTLEIGDKFDVGEDDMHTYIVLGLEDGGSVSEYKFSAVAVAGNRFPDTPSYETVTVPLVELPDGTRHVIPYEDYGQLLYIFGKIYYA